LSRAAVRGSGGESLLPAICWSFGAHPDVSSGAAPDWPVSARSHPRAAHDHTRARRGPTSHPPRHAGL